MQDLLSQIMDLAKTGYKSKQVANYKEIYNAAAAAWLDYWEKNDRPYEAEKTEVYRLISKMEL